MKGGLSSLLFSFLIFGSINSITGWRPFRVDLTDFTAISLDEDIVEVNATTHENGHFSVYLNLKKNVLQPFAKIELYMDSGNGLFDMKMTNETIDICRFFRDKRYLPVIQVIYRNFVDQGNFPTACPIKKNLYAGENMKMDEEKLPPTLPAKRMSMASTLMYKEGSILKPFILYKSIFQIRNVQTKK